MDHNMTDDEFKKVMNDLVTMTDQLQTSNRETAAARNYQIVQDGLAKAISAFRQGRLSAEQFHQIDILARRVPRPANLGTMAKAVQSVQTGFGALSDVYQGSVLDQSGITEALGRPDQWFACYAK